MYLLHIFRVILIARSDPTEFRTHGCEFSAESGLDSRSNMMSASLDGGKEEGCRVKGREGLRSIMRQLLILCFEYPIAGFLVVSKADF